MQVNFSWENGNGNGVLVKEEVMHSCHLDIYQVIATDQIATDMAAVTGYDT